MHDKSLEDRQESFFLSETVKYLYLLFDVDNPINTDDMKYVFSTEGHVLPLAGEIETFMKVFNIFLTLLQTK